MGLTGVIVGVRLRLRRIASTHLYAVTRRFAHLDALLAAQDSPGLEHSVAWIDMSATGTSLGRGVLDCGEHRGEPWFGEEEGFQYDPGHQRGMPVWASA